MGSIPRLRRPGFVEVNARAHQSTPSARDYPVEPDVPRKILRPAVPAALQAILMVAGLTAFQSRCFRDGPRADASPSSQLDVMSFVSRTTSCGYWKA
jgi:hypothetical protein